MLKLLWCEYLKLKRSKILVVGLAGTLIVPFFVIVRAVTDCITHPGTAVSLFTLYDNALLFLMLLFGPMMLTILGSWIVSREYRDGTLKNIFAIPVSPGAFLACKLLFFALLALAFMLASWLEILVLELLCSVFLPVSELSLPSALFFLVRMLFGGVLLWATQTPLIYLTVRSKGFAAPVTAMTGISLLNVVLSGSQLAGYYPWAAAYLLTLGKLPWQGCPRALSLAVIAAVCLLGAGASLIGFQKEGEAC